MLNGRISGGNGENGDGEEVGDTGKIVVGMSVPLEIEIWCKE